MLETDACRRELVDAEFLWTSFRRDPAQYLHDHDADLRSVVNLSFTAYIASRSRRYVFFNGGVQEAEIHWWRNQKYPFIRYVQVRDRLLEWWYSFVIARDRHLRGSKISFPGLLVRHGGGAVLPCIDELLNAGFSLEPTNASIPFLASVVDHFVRRCWAEKSLELPTDGTMDDFRKVLLWLAEKTGDRLQINWRPP
jgi:hypothetical protein